MAALLGVLLWRAWRRRWDGLATVELFLVGWFLAQGALAVLGEGLVNVHQHLLGSRLSLDLGLAILASRVVSFVLGGAERALLGRLATGSAGRSGGPQPATYPARPGAACR